MAGRPPKPTALKRLAGNPGKRPLNSAEPQFEARVMRAPTHLTPEAKREWRRVSKELAAVGLLSVVDRAALAAYCQSWARWVEAETIVAEKGAVLKTTNGNIIQNPYLSIANRALEDVRRFAVEFGMTPSSRSRVTTKGQAESDPFEEYVRRKLGEMDAQPAAVLVEREVGE